MPKPFTKKAKMRVMIARDVIKALNTKRITPDSAYMKLPPVPEDDDGDLTEYELQFPDLTITKEERSKLTNEYKTPEHCSVCGIGALFVAAVDRFDKLKVRDIYTPTLDHVGSYYTTNPELDLNHMLPYLRQWFSEKQLALIEVAFEGDLIGDLDEPSDGARYRAARMHERLELESYDQIKMSGPECIMRGIMENIIRHKGEFRP